MIRNFLVVMAAKFSYIGWLILILTFFSSNVTSQELSGVLCDFFARLEQREKEINTIKVEFVQTIFFESTGEKQKIIGIVFLKKPNSIYITQQTPQEQKIYINGKTIIIYTPNERQAIVDTWKNSVDGYFYPVFIVNFGSSWREIKKTNNITLDGYDDNRVVIKIQSLKNKSFNANIYIAKTSMLPEKAVITSEGTKIELVFKNYIVNPELAVDTFNFNAPNDVEIIKLY
jgi:chaperone LolA